MRLNGSEVFPLLKSSNLKPDRGGINQSLGGILCCGMRLVRTSSFNFSSPFINVCRKTSRSIKVAGLYRLSSLNKQSSVLSVRFYCKKKATCNSKSSLPVLLPLPLLQLPPRSPLPSLGKPLLLPASAVRDIFDAVSSFSPQDRYRSTTMKTDYYYYIGKSAVSPSDASTLLKPLGYSPSDISGYVGRECTALSDASKSWYVSNRSMNVLIFNF